MQIGMVGLGRMGANMTTRLLRGGHHVVVYDRSDEAVRHAATEGAAPTSSLEELTQTLDAPRAVWIMVPAGEPTEQTVQSLARLLSRSDTVIDGGNSNYRDTMRRAAMLKEPGLHFVDSGTSGGVWGLANGYSLMIGGERGAVERPRSVFE